MNALVQRCVLFAAALLLGACSVSRFEAPLGDKLDTCDPHWKGLWIGEDHSGKPGDEKDAAGIYVDPACRFFMLDQEGPGKPLRPTEIAVQYATVGREQYLVFSDAALKPVEDLGPVPGMNEPPEKTFLYFRYRVHGDRIDVFDVDHEKLAHWILDDKIKGHLLKTSGTLSNFVRGDAKTMVAVVSKFDLFEHKPMVVLQHRDQTPEQFEAELTARPGKGHSP